MRLKDKRNAFDGGSVGAFATLNESLLEQSLRIGKLRDALAGVALAAKVIGEAFAICGLGEHPREGEFTYTTRAGEKQGVRDALAAESATERGDDTVVAEKFREGQVRALLGGESS